MVAGRLTFRGGLFMAVLACSATFAARTASAAATNYYWNSSTGMWDTVTSDWNSPLIGSTPSVDWSDDSPNYDSTAIFSGGTAGTVTLGATVNPDAIDFNTTGYTVAGSGSFVVNLNGSTPAINVGLSTGNAAFTSTISANVTSTSATAPLVITDLQSGGAAAINAQLNFGGSLTVNSGSLTLVGNSIATVPAGVNTPAVPSVFTVSAPSLSLQTLTFNSPANNSVVLSPATSGASLTLTGSSPTINVGVFNTNPTPGMIASINENVTTTSPTAPLVITNYESGAAPALQQLNLGSATSTISIGSSSLQINNPTTGTFTVNAPSMSLQTLTFNPSSGSSPGTTELAGAAANSVLTFTGPTPTIYSGAPGNTANSTNIAHVYETVNMSPSSGPLVIDNLDGSPSRSAVSFGNGATTNLSATSQNSFPNGIALYSASSATFDSQTATTATVRLNFNLPGANGTNVPGGAGPIYVYANGAIITDEGSQNQFTLNMTNNIVLNAGNLSGSQLNGGNFITAIGGTKPLGGSTVVNWAGVISGNGGVLIGNDVAYASGGAGVTQISNQMTYTGATIVNSSAKGIFQMDATNALPSTTNLQFGYSFQGALTGTLQTNTIGAVDLNGYSQTIKSLTSNVDPATAISGLTNSNSSPNAGLGQVATPILTITGSTVDTYTGGIGIGPSGTGFGAAGYPSATNNIGLTRAGTGTTILTGSTPTGGATKNVNTYTGPTTVGDPANVLNDNSTCTLQAGSIFGFSQNSNYTVYGNLDLGNYSNSINSLASSNTAGAQGVVTTSANPILPTGGATLTIGSNTTANANTAPVTTFYGVLQNGTGGPLSLIKTGHGTQILAGQNTYTGATTISGGTLSLASGGSLSASSTVTVNPGGTLAGAGTAQGSVQITSGGTIAPGTATAIGGLSVGSLTLSGGSNYTWKITNAAGTNPGTDYDTVTSTGPLTLSSVSPSSPVTIIVNALNLTGLSTTTANPQSWTILQAPSLVGTFSPGDFNVDTTVGNLFSTFVVSNPSNGNLVLTYTPGTTPTNLTWVGPSGSGGGTGSWAPTGGTNWNNGSSNVAWNSSNGADFNAGSGIVTLSAPLSAPLITFDVGGYTIAGSSALTASTGFGSLTVQVTNSGTTATINAPINSPLTKIGNGTLVIGSTSSTFGSSKSATVSAGTLQGTTASLTATNINDNGTLVFDQSTSGNYAGTLSGTGQVVVQNSLGTGSPVVALTGTNNTYSGGTAVNSNATLSVASVTNLGTTTSINTTSGPVTASAGALVFNGGSLRTTPANGAINYGGVLSVTANGGTITDGGSGAMNAFYGGATLATGAVLTKNGSGTLQIVGNGWSGSGSIVIGAGTLLVGSESDANSNTSTFLGGNSVTLNNNTTLTIAASSDSAASITPPNLTLKGNVTLAMFQTGGAGPLNPVLNSTTTINPGSGTASSTITIANSSDFGNPLSGSCNLTLGNTTFAPTSGTITIQTIAPSPSTSASTGLTFGAVTDNGNATVFLGQGNKNASTPVLPGPGIQFNGVPSGNTPTMTGAWTIGDPADTNGQVVAVAIQESTKSQLAMTTGNITVNPGSQLAMQANTGLYGPTSGTQTITLYGTGPVDSNDKATGAMTLSGKYTAEFNSNVNFVIGNSVMINGVPTPTGHVDIDLSDGSGTKSTILQFDGPVTGAGGLNLQGGGSGDNYSQVIFAGNNNLTGETTVKGGQVIVEANSSIGTGSLTMGQTTGRSPILILNNAAQSIKNLSSTYDGSSTPVTQTIQLNATALTINETDTSGTADYGVSPTDGTVLSTGQNAPIVNGSAAVITGSGSIIYAGAPAGNGNPAAYLSLSSANTYTGGTTVTGGTLATTVQSYIDGTTSSGTLGSGPVNVTGGVLDVSATPLTFGALTVGSGGTLNVGLGNTITSTGAASFAGTLDMIGTASASSYELIGYTSYTGLFATPTNLPNNYALVYTSSQLNLQSFSTFNNTPSQPTTINGLVQATGTTLPVTGGGSTTINGPVQLSGTTVQVNNGSSLTVNGQPTLNGSSVAVGTSGLGGTGGNVTLSNTSGTPAVVTGTVTVTVAPLATFQLAGSSADLSSSVNITNNGSTASGGGFSVTGTNQVVGVISGTATTGTTTTYSGDTVVSPGASLTATQILQNTLTIGAGATVTIAPSGAGIPAVSVASDAGSTESASASVASAADVSSGSEIADPNDPLTAIQAAINSGSISSAKGAQLENRIAAIERLSATDPGLDVSLLENRVLAAIPSSSLWSAGGTAPLGETGAGLLAVDGGSFGSASDSALGGATAAFAPAAEFSGGVTAVPEPSSLVLGGLAAIGLIVLVFNRRGGMSRRNCLS